MKKTFKILVNAVPVIVMVALIPYVSNDYLLTLIYVAIIIVAFMIRRKRNELTTFVLGFCIMLVSEYFFIRTGVETFHRISLLGIMPLWLPFLWGYGFVSIKRAVEILK